MKENDKIVFEIEHIVKEGGFVTGTRIAKLLTDFEDQIRQDQKDKCAKAVRKIPETIVTGVCINQINTINAIMEASQ